MEYNLICLKKACDNLWASYRNIDKHWNVVFVEIGKWLFFHNYKTPFNSSAFTGICKDKEHGYELVRDLVSTPKTKGYLDPDVDDFYDTYLEFRNYEEIITDIEQEFSYPLVIKKNKWSQWRNVFLCRSREEVLESIKTVFKRDESYDYVVLAQEYIKIQREFRIIFFRWEIVFWYHRDYGDADFGAQYWENSVGWAKDIVDNSIFERVQKEFWKICHFPGWELLALDIAEREDGSLSLIELNSGPKFSNYISDNGQEKVVEMYEKILKKLLSE